MSGTATPVRPRPVALALGVGFVAFVITAFFAFTYASTAGHADYTVGHAYVRQFDGATSGVDRLLARGDGQAYAALAEDPFLSRPEAFRLGNARAAYRMGRPLFGYAIWATSSVTRAPVADVMPWLVALGAGFTVFAAVSLLQSVSAPITAGLGALALFVYFGNAGAHASTVFLTPEFIALGFAFMAVRSWRHERWWAASGWMIAASLTRETMLLVACVLALDTWRQRRGWRTPAVLVAPSVGALCAWWTVVRVRFEAWPTSGTPPHTMPYPPVLGLVDAARAWVDPGVQWLWVLAGIVIVVAAVALAPRSILTWIALAYVGLALALGPATWRRWEDFGRPLTPLYGFAILAVIEAVAARRVGSKADAVAQGAAA